MWVVQNLLSRCQCGCQGIAYADAGVKRHFFSTWFMVQQGKMVHLITYNFPQQHTTQTLLLHTQLYCLVLVVWSDKAEADIRAIVLHCNY